MALKKDLSKTKEVVIRSAVKLFNMKGYDGTSVRAIADEAGVNVALVSYYFGGKKGLLEYLMSSFFEGYIETLENTIACSQEAERAVSERLLDIADALIAYQQQSFYLSRFVHREMTMDTMLIRELMASYLMKEKFLLENVFQDALEESGASLPLDLLTIQFREMVIMPFLQPQYLRKVYFMQPSEVYFRRHYLRYIEHWANRLFLRKEKEPLGRLVL